MCDLTKNNILQGEVCKVHRDEAFKKEHAIKEVTGGVNYFPHGDIKVVYIILGENMVVITLNGEYFTIHLKGAYYLDPVMKGAKVIRR
jgi:hypothetical protein